MATLLALQRNWVKPVFELLCKRLLVGCWLCDTGDILESVWTICDHFSCKSCYILSLPSWATTESEHTGTEINLIIRAGTL